MERTLALIQNDAIERDLTEEILKRFTDAGLKIISRKEVVPTREMTEKHYQATEEQIVGMGNKTMQSMQANGFTPEKIAEFFGTSDPRRIGQDVLEWARKFITGRKLIAIVLEGENAVQKVRQLVGATDPAKAEKGSIRGDLADDTITRANLERRKVRNLVHAADSVEAAKREITIWFGSEEL